MATIEMEDLKQRYLCPLIIEVRGDQSAAASSRCEVVDVYVCPHDEGLHTILHIPAGSVPAGMQIESIHHLEHFLGEDLAIYHGS